MGSFCILTVSESRWSELKQFMGRNLDFNRALHFVYDCYGWEGSAPGRSLEISLAQFLFDMLLLNVDTN